MRNTSKVSENDNSASNYKLMPIEEKEYLLCGMCFEGVWRTLEDCSTLSEFTKMSPDEFSLNWLPTSASGTKVNILQHKLD